MVLVWRITDDIAKFTNVSPRQSFPPYIQKAWDKGMTMKNIIGEFKPLELFH